MQVNALDHVNIITADLDGSSRFYAELLGLGRRDVPSLPSHVAQWMHDASGRPILHLNSESCPRRYDRETKSGPTGAVHHVALNCSGYDEVLSRLRARDADWQTSSVSQIGLRQIFTMDPNGVLLELNFYGV